MYHLSLPCLHPGFIMTARGGILTLDLQLAALLKGPSSTFFI